MILLAYRHGLRVSELVALRWDQVDLREGRLQVNRVKRGTASVHFLLDPKLRALQKLEREEPTGGSYVFASERDGPLMAVGFWKPLARAGAESTVDFPVHPHVPRHSCGYKLANDGHNIRAIQHYLGHKNIQHAVSYTELRRSGSRGLGGLIPISRLLWRSRAIRPPPGSSLPHRKRLSAEICDITGWLF